MELLKVLIQVFNLFMLGLLVTVSITHLTKIIKKLNLLKKLLKQKNLKKLLPKNKWI